jgi:hypothetical protein
MQLVAVGEAMLVLAVMLRGLPPELLALVAE